MEGILYVGHGSRVEEGNDQLRDFVQTAKKEIPYSVQEISFLEFAEPDIFQGVRRCVEQGVRSLAVVPIFLLSAGHLKIDIPRILAEVEKLYPEITIRYGAPFGLDDKIIEVLVKRLEDSGWDRGEDSDILLVGRGSSDELAIADFQAIASKLQEETQVKRVDTAFLAAATPTFEDGLEKVKKFHSKHVYVLPYLLFTGVLMREMKEKIDQANETSYPEIHLCDYLGFDKQLISVLQHRTKETLQLKPYIAGGEERV